MRFAVALAVLSVSSAGASFGEPRLATDVVPTAESVVLEVDPSTPDYRGTATIDLDVRRATSEFRLHASGMSIESVILRSDDGATIANQHAVSEGLLSVRVHGALIPGRHQIIIRFARPFGVRAHGLYRVNKNGRDYAYTDLEPTGLRDTFPCFDEPAFKIPFTLTAVIRDADEALSNTPIAELTRRDDGTKVVRFQPTPPTSTYLVALAVGPFDTREILGLGVPGRVVTTAGDAKNVELAATTTATLLRALEDWFGIPYPYAKLDLIAVPEYWAGAMENPGAITYSEGVLVLDPSRVSLQNRRTQFRITAHELAHQWFGDYVTMKWWDDLWLNEAFADWMGDKITTQVHPEVGIELGELSSIQGAMAGDARVSAEPIRRPVPEAADALRDVGTVYLKGKAVLGMFEQWMGPETFRAGVNLYLARHAWSNAVAEDLWSALSATAGRDVAPALTTFIEQPGIPLVEVKPKGAGAVEITQHRFHSLDSQVPPLSWKIPIVLRFAVGGEVRTHAVLLEEASTVLALADRPLDWVLPNSEARGWYFWKIPPAMLARLTADAATRLSARERIGLLGNLGGLFRAGAIEARPYLDALTTLAADHQPLVVAAALTEIGVLENSFLSEANAADYAAWLRRTLAPAYQRHGNHSQPGEDPAVSLLRHRLLWHLGGLGADPEVRAFADDAATRFLKDPASIDPAIAATVLLLHAQRGDARLYEELRGRFESASDPGDRDRFLEALGEFHDPTLRGRALAYALAGPLRAPEITTIPQRMADHPSGRDHAWTWFTHNYDAILERAPGPTQPWLAYFAENCAAKRIAEAKRFFADPRHQVPGTLETLAKVLDSARDCVALRSRAGREVTAYWRGHPTQRKTPAAGE